MNLEVLYSAAHADFPDSEPLGGGKAVADYLIREWRAREPFTLSVLSPNCLGLKLSNPLAQMTELEYARFCREFERVTTSEIQKRDPQQCVVLCNDISEGPNFAALGERGYRVATIFHVDVAEYFTRFYLRGLIRPETAARFHWFGVMPEVLKLVFEKQYQCVRHSMRIVVPSAPMRDVILRCYPWCAPEKIVVLPWGNIAASTEPAVCNRRSSTSENESALPSVGLRAGAERRYSIGADEIVIITLSRLSPEKGIERLLAALPYLDATDKKARVFICGGPAYMKGRAYEQKLHRLAAPVKTARVEFTGHVTGTQKAALLQRADIFVSPSMHESYGLTIAEALAAECRVVSHHHYGAEGEVVDCADARALANALGKLIAKGRTVKTGRAGLESSSAAEKMAALLLAISKIPAERSQH